MGNKILSIQGQKGGTSKTTLTINLAHALARRDYRVLVIDSDPQKSALSWLERRAEPPPFDIMGLPTRTIHRDVRRLSRHYDRVIIDGPPRVMDVARSGIAGADRVLIPARPSPLDIMAIAETLELVEEASSLRNEDIRTTMIITQQAPNVALNWETRSELKHLAVPVLYAMMAFRPSAYPRCAVKGLTVFEMTTDNYRAATQEIDAICKELEDE